MELIGKLKDSVSKAKDREEAKVIIENAGIKLTEEELDMVAGRAQVNSSMMRKTYDKKGEFQAKEKATG